MNLTRTSLPAALVLLAACVTEEDDVIAPIGVAMEGSTPVGLEVLPYTGNAPVTTIARTVNAWGAAVPSAPEEIVVGGSVESLSIDGLGYGRITVEQVGVTEILGGEAPAEVVALSGSWPGFGVQRGEVPLGDAVFAASAPSGVALASASEVWWVGADMPAHRVLQWPEGELISGMRSGNADSDGLPDLVVWGGSTVIMLRGRPGGGFAWGGGWQSPGNAAVGASLGDANLDSAEDIAVVWAIANGDSMMEILTGDGIGGFSGIPVPLSDVPGDVAIGDNDGNGVPELTTLVAATWQRFNWSTVNNAWEGTGPNLNGLNFVAGTRLFSGEDFNGDGADEIVFVGPLQSGQDRQVLLYDLVGQANVTFLRLVPYAAEISMYDGNEDGLADVFMLEEDGNLVVMSYTDGDANQLSTSDIGERGPIALGDYDGEDLRDLLVGGDTWTWWHGTEVTTQAELKFWSDGEPELDAFALGIEAWAPIEVDGLAETREFATLVRDGGDTFLEVIQLLPGDLPVMRPFGNQVLLASPARNIIDIAVCGDSIYSLLDGELHHTVFGGSSISAAATGSVVACGQGPSGASAATLAGDTVTLWDTALTELGTQTETGAENIALGRASADLASCNTPGCSVVWWTVGGVGDWARVTNDGIEAHGQVLHGGGSLTLEDVDGNGTEDLLASWDGGRLAVYRTTDSAIGQGWIGHTRATAVGPAFAADGSGEGDVDLLFLDDSGTILLTPPPGTPPASGQ